MKAKYEKNGDAAYIYLVKESHSHSVKATYECDLSDIEKNYGIAPILGMINLDFDEEGHLLGIEIIGAKRILPRDLVEGAESY